MLSTVRTYASFVKFSHTVFALPFAIAGMVAAYAVPVQVVPTVMSPPGHWAEGVYDPRYVSFDWRVLALVVLCMVGARSFAMALNRILDRRIDALNPRTAQREIPTGKLKLWQAWLFAVLTAVTYFSACAALGPVTLALSPIPISLMAFYPFTKRFTALCHLVLGASLGLAPVGAWVATRAGGSWLFETPRSIGWMSLLDWQPWFLGSAVMLWVAGFDVIYALQDDEFDRTHGLHSIPASLGRRRSLWVARCLHLFSAALLLNFTAGCLMNVSTLPWEIELPKWLWAAPCVMLVGMIYQHSLVKPNDLSRVNMAFFTVNGIISVVFGAIFVAAWLLA